MESPRSASDLPTLARAATGALPVLGADGVKALLDVGKLKEIRTINFTSTTEPARGWRQGQDSVRADLRTHETQLCKTRFHEKAKIVKPTWRL